MSEQTTQTAPSLVDRMKELSQQLEEGVREVFSSGKYAEYLTTMSRFHKYSARNSLLIHLQNPDATHVAGFEAWKGFNRNVKKGEKGLTILAPSPYKKTVENDKGEQVELTVPAFRPVKVFDISQTWGEPLPQLTQRLADTWGKDLSSDEATRAGNYRAALIEAVERVSPFPVAYEPISRESCNGYCDPEEGRIVVRPDISQAQTLKTLIHEVVHARLHASAEVDRVTAEVQAESVAYITCQHFGVDSSQYSFGYLAGWSRDQELSVLQDSLKVIQRESHAIVAEVTVELERQQELVVEAAKLPELGPGLTRQAEAFINTTEAAELHELNPGHARMAEALIHELETDKPLFGPEERLQIIDFAYQTGNIDEAEMFAKELALRGFEQKRGYADPVFGQLMEKRIEELKAGAEPQSYSSMREKEALHEQAVEARLEAEVRASFKPPDEPKPSITDKLQQAKETCARQPQRESNTHPARMAEAR